MSAATVATVVYSNYTDGNSFRAWEPRVELKREMAGCRHASALHAILQPTKGSLGACARIFW